MTEIITISDDEEDIMICAEIVRNNHLRGDILLKNDQNINSNNSIIDNNRKTIYSLKRHLDIKKQCKQNKKPKNICVNNSFNYKDRIHKTNVRNISNWGSQISSDKFYAAPVTFFKHLSFSHFWYGIYKNILVEVPLLTNYLLTSTKSIDKVYDEIKNFNGEFYWIAWIQKVVGFNALMRYEGFDDGRYDFWIHLYNPHVHPLGWCAKHNRKLNFPQMVESKQSDWKLHLKQLFITSPTITNQFKENTKYNPRFRIGHWLEAVDCDNLSQMKIAKIVSIIGNRLSVQYWDKKTIFCFADDSPLIHPIGWSYKVGHRISVPQGYQKKFINQSFDKDDAPEDLFIKMPKDFSCQFMKGMKLEAKDPLNLKQITVATVEKVLRDGYLMLRFENSNNLEFFCYHCTSPDIFPVGFCEINSIPLTPPKNEIDFNWRTYLHKYNFIQAPKHCFYQKKLENHDFKVGMKVECADLTFPHLICMASVTQIVGRLLRIQFDGWKNNFDQWLDCESPDMYPVGWCEHFGHKLQGSLNLITIRKDILAQ